DRRRTDGGPAILATLYPEGETSSMGALFVVVDGGPYLSLARYEIKPDPLQENRLVVQPLQSETRVEKKGEDDTVAIPTKGGTLGLGGAFGDIWSWTPTEGVPDAAATNLAHLPLQSFVLTLQEEPGEWKLQPAFHLLENIEPGLAAA